MRVEYEQMPAGARVWVYQSPRPLSAAEQAEWLPRIADFVAAWTSHQQAVAAWGGILHDRFLVLMADETMAGPSGCSIDSSVAFVRRLGEALGIDWFDRWNFAFRLDGRVESADRDRFAELYAQGQIGETTPVFDNLVSTKADLESRWEVELGKSWHKNLV